MQSHEITRFEKIISSEVFSLYLSIFSWIKGQIKAFKRRRKRRSKSRKLKANAINAIQEENEEVMEEDDEGTLLKSPLIKLILIYLSEYHLHKY